MGILSGIFGGGGGGDDSKDAIKAGYTWGTKMGEEATQLSQEDVASRLEAADKIIAQLRSKGMAADDAFVLQQSLIGARGDELSGMINNLQSTISAVNQGFIQPQELKQLGSFLNQSIMQQVASGNPSLQKAFDVAEQQGIESIPNLRASVEELQSLGQGLGKTNQADFDQRFDPAIRRLNQATDERQQSITQGMNARGVRAGSSNEAHQTDLLNREYTAAANDLALQAQSQAEAQRVSEYNSRQAEPANILNIRADQQGSTAMLLQRQANAVNEASAPINTSIAGVNAAQGAYNSRAGVEAPLASERRDQTLGESLRQDALPTQAGVAIKAGVTPGAMSSASQLGTAKMSSDANRYNTTVGGITNLAGIGAGLATSDVNKKENIAPLDEDKAMGALRRMPTASYEFKEETGLDDGQVHTGSMAQDMPDEVTNDDKTKYNIQDYLGLVTGALRSLDKRLQKAGV